jgi:hypothetical protein
MKLTGTSRPDVKVYNLFNISGFYEAGFVFNSIGLALGKRWNKWVVGPTSRITGLYSLVGTPTDEYILRL